MEAFDADSLDLDEADLDLDADDLGADGAEGVEAASDPYDLPDEPKFGAAGVSDDSYQEPVSYSQSFHDYYGDVTGRPMEEE